MATLGGEGRGGRGTPRFTGCMKAVLPFSIRRYVSEMASARWPRLVSYDGIVIVL